MKNKILVFASLFFVAFLAGCNSAQELNDVRIGMTKAQVLSILGTPNSTSAQANVEYLTYYLIGDSNYGRDQPYMVRLVDGKVESYGRFTQLTDLYNRPVTGGDANIPPSPYPVMGSMVAVPGPAPAAASVPDLAGQLEKLKALKDEGVLTDDEFQRAKAKLLSSQ